jgi:RNA polymerase sigma factor (sigma-70 family)
MAFTAFNPILRNLRRHLVHASGPAVADQQLLKRFVTRQDEAAFELLVWRHGPMVLGVCRRLLRDQHDAEDAFQATLLVLARKAHSIGRGSLGGWLYQVAYRIALRSLAQARRRRRVETHMAALGSIADAHDSPDPAHEELRSALDCELNALPEKYRVPVVLCYLQGLTNEEAARQLGCPPGTVKTRLRHARSLLGDRLARRGFPLAAALVTAGTLPNVLSATMPAALTSRTASAAVLLALGKATSANVSASVVHLTNGVLQAMFMMKLKWSAMVLAMVLAVTGIIGFGVCSPSATAPAAGGGDGKPAAPATPVNATARAHQLRKQIAQLQEELRRAETAAQDKPAGKDKVAVIFDDIALTRDQFAEFLLARAREEQVAAFINHRIIAHACRVQGITVTDAEVEAAFTKDTEPLGGQDALKVTLARHGKTPDVWKQDVIRPRLLLAKLCRSRIVVTEKHLHDAFDDAYGEKVVCQLILWPKDRTDEAERLAAVLRQDAAAFDDAAARQATPTLAALKGKVPPLARDSPGSEALAEAAFRLQPGEVSTLIDVSEGVALVRCLRRIPADATKKFEQVRDTLRQKVFDDLLQAELPRTFQELKQRAHPEVLWRVGSP